MEKTITKTGLEDLNFCIDTHYLDAIESNWYQMLCLLQDEINHATFSFFRSKGIKSVSLPITTGSVTSPMGLGSDSLPVKINLEGEETYLSDSMQFHLEYAIRLFGNGTHYVMPSFRGEKADKRHLCQFYHSEAEIPGKLDDVISLVNQYILYLCNHIIQNIKRDLSDFTGDILHIENFIALDGNIPRITFNEACDLLGYNDIYVNIHPEGFRTINSEGEKKLIEHFGGFVWLTHHDYKSVPFYQDHDAAGSQALNADLLFGIGEVVGAGQRHVDDQGMLNAMNILNVNPEEYHWYLEMKKKYPMITSGFGMGIERFILWVLKHDDIRDCQLIPRFNGITITP